MSNSDYSRRMNHVLDYIDRHLDVPLELDTLAGIAHFSPYHFHRIFAAWLGETVGGVSAAPQASSSCISAIGAR